MKKRNILKTALLVLILGTLTACDLIEECGTCERVTVELDGTKELSAPTIFCAEELQDKKDAGTTEVDGKFIYWVCN